MVAAALSSDSAFTCPESQQVSPPLVHEETWSTLMMPRRRRWEARSDDQDLTGSQRRYAHRRARRMKGTYASKVDGCARAGVVVKCGCPGKRDVRWYSCRQHLVCERCQHKRAKRTGARIRHGLEAAAATAHEHWRTNGRLMAVMITIGVRHTGDIEADRRTLASGWRRFYKAYHRRFGAFPYVGTHEITTGTDGLGHPHAHIVVLWPYRDWFEMQLLWRAACPQSEHISFRASHSVKGAARYVSKYISKGVQTADFSPELRARVLAGTYGTRWLMSSVRFWQPFAPVCPCCSQPIVRARLRDPWPDDAHSTWRTRRPDDPDPLAGGQCAIEAFS